MIYQAVSTKKVDYLGTLPKPQQRSRGTLMKFLDHLRNAFIGWIAGLLVTAGFSWLWQQIFPVIDRTGQGAALPYVLLFILAGVSPVAIAGGIIGGRLPKEGGVTQQLQYAALFGALFIIPVACFLFWYTAW